MIRAQGIIASLRYRDFRLLWLGSVAEHSGEWVAVLALNWIVLELTNSAWWLGWLNFLRFFPMLLLPFIGGVVADRVDRRKLLITTLVAFAALYVALGLLVLTKVVTLWMVMFIAFLSGIVLSFNHPVRSAIVPNVVAKEHLTNAVSLDMTAVMATRIFAPAIAGFLVDRFGTGSVFLVATLGPMFGLVATGLMHVPDTPSAARQFGMRQNLTDGLRYVSANKAVLGLILLYLVPMVFVHPYYSVLLPVVAKDVLDVGAAGLGLLSAAAGIGSLASLLWIASIGEGARKGTLAFGSAILTGVLLLLFGFSPWFNLSLLLAGCVGLALTAFLTLNTTLLQAIIPDDLRGRVMSLREVTFGFLLFGSVLMGGLGAVVGAPLALVITGTIAAALGSIMVVLLPQARRLS